MAKKIIVMIPTYNEKENIGKMIEVLEDEIFPEIKKYEMSILIVDDNSPDGTSNLVEEKMQKYKNIIIYNGEKGGLGKAFKRGIGFAINKMGATAIIKMDADFQHNPKYIIDLLKKYEKGHNYVVGTRYSKGGSLPKDWSFSRRFLSKYGGLFVRILLFFPRVRILTDISSGFALADVKNVLNRIDLNKLSDSFGYTHQLVYMVINLGVHIEEVPINFEMRSKGNSKLHINIILKDLISILIFRIRY